VALPTLEQPYVCLPDGILPGRRSEVYRRNLPATDLTGPPHRSDSCRRRGAATTAFACCWLQKVPTRSKSSNKAVPTPNIRGHLSDASRLRHVPCHLFSYLYVNIVYLFSDIEILISIVLDCSYTGLYLHNLMRSNALSYNY
jgi:hypothetical protein